MIANPRKATCLLSSFAYVLVASTTLLAQQHTGSSTAPSHIAPHRDSQIQIERGKPNKVVDGVGWVLGIPSKLILWNRSADNHHVSAKTQRDLTHYMAANKLTSSKVRINQYHPLDDWKRLKDNKQVGAGWRYTFGVIHTLGETIFPGRLFGGDHYNPYTDTVHIYSDIPSLAMEQSAYAKDVRHRNYPGTYAAGQDLPFVGLWHERRSKKDVFSYVNTFGSPQQRQEAYEVLQPQYGSEIGGELGMFVPGAQPLFSLSGAAVGHVVGRRQSQGVVSQASYHQPVGQ